MTTLSLELVLEDIAAERARQDDKWGSQRDHPDGTGYPGSTALADQARALCDRNFAAGKGTWSDILGEEMMEAMAETDPTALRTELIQVAAVCAVWIEAIDSRSL